MRNEGNISESRQSAVDWLYGRINYERSTPIPYSEQGLKLDRVRELLRRLGDPQERLRIVHVAGTKGKGSTGAMIGAGLQAAGHRVGIYSSPHLDRIEERFAVNGEPCSAETLVALVDLVRPVAEAMDNELERGPTFFDLTTAMALSLFAGDVEQAACDGVVLEVGLGGRLDSTNVVTPEVAVITSISLDHTKQLGDTLPEIAVEKSGIIKPGVPMVSGVVDSEAGDVIQRIAKEQGSPFYRRGHDFDLQLAGDAWCFVRDEEIVDNVRPARPGSAQADNAAVALAVLGLLADAGWKIPIEARRQGVATAKLPARMERFEGEPLVIIDGAHNRASAAALAESLDALCQPVSTEHRVLLIAMSDDKDANAVLEPLIPHFAHIVVTRFIENPRAIAPESLAELLRDADVTIAQNPTEGFAVAQQLAGTKGAVVVAGSLFLAAEVRRFVTKN